MQYFIVIPQFKNKTNVLFGLSNTKGLSGFVICLGGVGYLHLTVGPHVIIIFAKR
jgi:hypothetical protein